MARALLFALLIGLGLPGAASASCMAPTRETACPACALVVIGTYREVGDPRIEIERIVGRRGPRLEIGTSVPVTPARPIGRAPGTDHLILMECAFVAVDGWRMLYYLTPDPQAPGRWRIAWGFAA